MKRAVLSILFILLVVSHCSAQFYYFGRNKVQYTDFQWHVLKTEHFEIYFYPEMRELAERGGYVAEQAYKRMEQKFNHTIARRIPLIFYSSHLHFQQTNVTPGFIPEGMGGFFEFLKGRVVIPANGSTEQFAHVIRHELVHVFMRSKINRVLLDHRQSQDRDPPLWFTEGLAEYWSTEWDTQAEMVLRDAVLNNYIVPLSKIDRIKGSFLMYKQGQNIVEYIAKEYGEERILLLMENFWKEHSFDDVMKMTIGKTFQEFDEEWLYSLKKRYYPKLAQDDLPSGVTKSIVKQGFNSKPSFYSSNNTREVYFVGNHTGYTNIYKMNLDDKDAKPEVIIEGERTDEFEAFHLFQSKIDISKEGLLAFVTKSGEHDVLHIYDVKKKILKESIQFQSLVMLSSPTWSPDGRQIAFSSIDKSGNNDLYLYDLLAEKLTRLTNDFYDDRDPDWSPNGKYLSFSSDRTSYGKKGKYNLFLFDIEKGAIEPLAYGDQNNYSPSWSDDGKWIAFISDKKGTQNIWIVPFDPDSSITYNRSVHQMRKVTSFSTAAFDPEWDDRGGLIFTVFENFGFQIHSLGLVLDRYQATEGDLSSIPDQSGEPWRSESLNGFYQIEEFRYDGKYSLDIAQSQISTDPVFGTSGGAALAMSDVLGNDIYYFLIYNTAQTRDELLDSFNIAMSRISLGKRTNHSYGIFRFSGNRYDLTDPNLFYFEKSYGAYFALSYPLSKFRRLETQISITNSDKDIFIDVLPRRALLISNTVSFVWDNSLWGPTGPVDGNRMKLSIAYTSDIQYSNVSYYTMIADYRKYFRLGIRTTLASRAHLWLNDGKEARRFFIGGSWDLRGWPRWSLRGQKVWLTSHELRFPFIDELEFRLPFGEIRFGSIRGALFADAGSAWDRKYVDTKGSIGAGVRMNLGGFLVLRYDVGKRIEKNFSRFQERLFHQFFFGWDF